MHTVTNKLFNGPRIHVFYVDSVVLIDQALLSYLKCMCVCGGGI